MSTDAETSGGALEQKTGEAEALADGGAPAQVLVCYAAACGQGTRMAAGCFIALAAAGVRCLFGGSEGAPFVVFVATPGLLADPDALAHADAVSGAGVVVQVGAELVGQNCGSPGFRHLVACSLRGADLPVAAILLEVFDFVTHRLSVPQRTRERVDTIVAGTVAELARLDVPAAPGGPAGGRCSRRPACRRQPSRAERRRRGCPRDDPAGPANRLAPP